MNTIYLDYNATTPIDKKVAEAMRPFLDVYFGNPSSSHSFGIQTRKAVEKARMQVATFLNCKPSEIIFTSGGTESNNHAIKGYAFANKTKGNHIITSTIEHPAVIEVCKFLENFGFEITYVEVDEFGIIDLQMFEKSIKPSTILVSIMHANNETGSIQPIEEISRIAKAKGIAVHTDAAQSAGKIPVDVQLLNVDLLSIAGHKLYAPKGIGVLFIREGITLEKFIHGANHEQNLRAGTENILEIAGLGKACEIAKRDFSTNSAHMKLLRDTLHDLLTKDLDYLKLNGSPEKRLPNTLNLSFENVEANTMLSELTTVAASAGAACHSDDITVSQVLLAMKVPINYAMGTIRFSTGKNLSINDIEQAAKEIISVANRLRSKDRIIAQDTDIQHIKLTQYTHGLGCACKIRPQYLEKILCDLPIPTDKNVLVGTNTSDDAAVYRIDDNTAIVQTVDFFTPIVDSPYHFGAIAAANSLSDIYAMGAKPLFALNIVGFPDNRLPMEVLKQILKGASDKAAEAGIFILGGHTVEDSEPKFGMAVTGIVSPTKVLANSNAKAGDALILTKPIGTGILATAAKRGLAEEDTIQKMIQIMSELNAKAGAIMLKYPVNSCTDVTGFGLLGHLKEMSVGSKMNAVIFCHQVPVIQEAFQFIAANVVPGGSLNNLDYVGKYVNWSDTISQSEKIILCDAQTSGGLLISLPAEYKEDILKELHSANIMEAAIIGYFSEPGDGVIRVEK